MQLDPATRSLKGQEVLTWRNLAPEPASTLRFHLYYNAWRNNASTWMRELRLAGSADAEQRPADDWGWIDVTSIVVAGADGRNADLTARLRHISPDDGNPDDATVAEVPLDAAVPPGENLTVRIAWSSRVPRTFARTGFIGDFYFLAQWFPKIGVLESGGWNCHQFHAATEFFADFGVYDVRLTVPSGWIVGATGVEQRPHATNARRHDDAPVPRRGRARLRVDGQPALSWSARRRSSMPGCRAVDDPPAAAAGARRPGRAALRGGACGARVLRRLVRPLSRTRRSRSSTPPGRAVPAAWSTRR